jgi:hypothetical protein
MSHKLTQLKIKRLTLTSETVTTKKQEMKWSRKAKIARNKQNALLHDVATGIRESLFAHRKNVVRPEARAAHLAHAFLRGVPYVEVEQKAWTCNYPHFQPWGFWKKVGEMVYRFGDRKEFPDKETAIKLVNAWRNLHPGYSRFKQEPVTVEVMKMYGDAWFSILAHERALG